MSTACPNHHSISVNTASPAVTDETASLAELRAELQFVKSQLLALSHANHLVSPGASKALASPSTSANELATVRTEDTAMSRAQAASAILDKSALSAVGLNTSELPASEGMFSASPTDTLRTTPSAGDTSVRYLSSLSDFSLGGAMEPKLQDCIRLGFYVPFEIILSAEQGA